MSNLTEFISCTSQQVLFSPKGAIEGVLATAKGKTLQIVMKPELGATLARLLTPGKRLRVRAMLDHSHKTQGSTHPVYQFEAFADTAGNAIESVDSDPANATITGVVAALHFARHGQPNGVVLETGEFIHLRPRGMAQLGLGIGAKVKACGAVRMTVLGTWLLEAREVNRVVLE